MLEIKLGDLKKINEEGDKIFLSDATGNYGDINYVPSLTVEGQYDAVTNETGYGAPNTSREDLANFIVGVYKASTGDVSVSFEPYSNLSSREFTANATLDGWYKFNIISVGLVESETEPFYRDGSIVKKEGEVFVVVDPIDLVDTQYCSRSEDQFFVANNSKKLIVVNEAVNRVRMFDATNDRALRAQKKLEDEIRGLLKGAIIQFCRGNKAQAQIIIEFLNINTDKCHV